MSVKKGTPTALPTSKKQQFQPSVFLEKEEIHRIENHSNEDLIIIETQMGECIEDDIVRYEDDFNRA